MQVPAFCAQEDATCQEATVQESKQKNTPIKQELLQQKRNQKIAVYKAFAEANKQIVSDKESQLKQARAQKVNEQKISAANKKQIVLDKKAQLQKERDEMLAQKKEHNDLKPLKGASDYIFIKVRPLNEILEQAEQLLKCGEYEDALATYSYAYDIAKEKTEKKNILKKKSDIKDFITNWEHKRKIAEKKILQEVEQSSAPARKAQLQKERDEMLAQKQSTAESRKKAYLANKAQLQKEQAEKEAQDIKNAPPRNSLIAGYLCEEGVTAYKLGHYQAALSKFDKALLVEPNNQVAKKYREDALSILEQSENSGAN